MRQRKFPPRYPGQMLAKIPCPIRRKQVERSYERIANRNLWRYLNERQQLQGPTTPHQEANTTASATSRSETETESVNLPNVEQ